MTRQKKPYFDGSETIADILAEMPEASEILLSHGLSCVSCHINVAESLREGILGHGFDEGTVERILADLNEAAQDTLPVRKAKTPPTLTDQAAKKIHEFQAQQNQEGFGFKIEVIPQSDGSPSYFLDFLEKPEPGDRVIESNGIRLFLDIDSNNFLQGCCIDFKKTNKGEGFTINPV